MLEINIIAPFGHSFLKLVTYLINTTAKNSSQKNKINKIKEFLPCFALPCQNLSPQKGKEANMQLYATVIKIVEDKCLSSDSGNPLTAER